MIWNQKFIVTFDFLLTYLSLEENFLSSGSKEDAFSLVAVANLMIGLFVLGTPVALSAPIFSFIDPNANVFFSCIFTNHPLKDPWYVKFVLFPVLAIIQAYIFYFVVIIFCTWIYLLLPVIFAMIYSFRDFKYSGRCRTKVFKKLYKPASLSVKNIAFWLRPISMLLCETNLTLGKTIMPAHYLNVMLLSVAESSGAIFIPIGRHFIKDLIIKLMVVAIAFACIIYLITTLTCFGKLGTSHQRVLRSFKMHPLTPHEKRLVRSLRPCCFRIGSFHKVSRTTACAVTMAVLKYTGKVLISLRKHK